MSLEFSKKLQEARNLLGLSRSQFSSLIDVSDSTILRWEMATKDPHHCWERIIQFILDSPSFAVQILGQKPWITGVAWSERVGSLRQKLGWTDERLAEFLRIAGPKPIFSWLRGGEIAQCHQIMLSLLEIHSDLEQEDWPPALRFPEGDIITPERVKLLRQGLVMTQSDLGNLLHVDRSSVSNWETGNSPPGWCVNLLLRIIETFPRAVDLIEKIPWTGEALSPEKAERVRSKLGLTGHELCRLLSMDLMSAFEYERGGRVKTDCITLVYDLLDQYPEEFIEYIQGLSNPGGRACPIW